MVNSCFFFFALVHSLVIRDGDLVTELGNNSNEGSIDNCHYYGYVMDPTEGMASLSSCYDEHGNESPSQFVMTYFLH